MSNNKFSWKLKKAPAPGQKTVGVVRFGAIGDTMQAASVCAGLKKLGYWVEFYGTYPAAEVVAFDPHIDKIHIQGMDQMPMDWLGVMWLYQRKRHDRWVNLSESVETNMLASQGNIRYEWPAAARHAVMNHNYLELQHQIAGVPHYPNITFYPTVEEATFVQHVASRFAGQGVKQIVLWAMAGSARTHKLWPYTDQIIDNILQNFPDVAIVTVGDASAAELEPDFENKRLLKTCGKWTIRQVLAFMAAHSNLVVGPETGVLNAASCYQMPKVVFLSHSTDNNLTRDWINTAALYSPKTACPGRGNNEAPACHAMNPTFEPGCRRDEATGVAQCCADIKPEWAWRVIYTALKTGRVQPWMPPLVQTM